MTNAEKCRVYRLNHPGKAASDSRAWREIHPEKNSEYTLAWRRANREKNTARMAEYRRDHPDYFRKYNANRRALAQAFIDAAMAGGCVDCGTKEQVVLELDHVRGKKVADVSRLRGGSIRRLLEEIDKCETRCANCHRRITAERLALKRAA